MIHSSALPPLVYLTQLSRMIEQLQVEVLEPFELTPNDYSVLATLRRAGKPYALNPTRLYGVLQRSSGGMTKMLKRLEERGLIRRDPDPEDGRGSIVRLTRKGLGLQDRAFVAFLVASQERLAPLSAKQRDEVEHGLRTLTQAFEETT